MLTEDQSDTVAFLSTPAAFDGSVEAVGRVTTHASEIFIGRDRVFKLKRAVKYPFMDFSTRDLRHRYCEAEVRINRRTAPRLYLGVRPVVRDGSGTLRVGCCEEGVPSGEIVDWVVEMLRFDADRLFDRLAESGRLDRHVMESLADNIATFHAHAEDRRDGGGRAGIALTIEGNAKTFAQNGTGVVDPHKVAALIEAQCAELSEAAALLENRRKNGYVRHCHGDMHLGNIFLDAQDEPVLFDAIEFNESFSNIDVLYDLAFLLMDLDRRDLKMLGTIAMNRYMDITGSAWGLFALPLFLSLRATVRSLVACAVVKSIDDVRVREEKSAEACEYLDMAQAYLRPPEPRLIAVGGLSGSGKSRLGRDLAPYIGAAPGARVVRSDVLRKRIAGVHPLDRLGPQGYTSEMTAKTYQAVFDEARVVLATGHSVIADCVFSMPDERAAIEDVAGEIGVSFLGFWLEAAPEVMAERVTTRTKNASDADAEVVKKQLKYDLGEITWQRIDSSGTRAQTDDQTLKILGLSLESH